MKNKVIRGVLAAACVTTVVGTTTVFGAGTEQSLVNEASAATQEETEETSEAEAADDAEAASENMPEAAEKETETPDSATENAGSDLPDAETQSRESAETAVSVQAGNYNPWVNENGIWYFKDPDGTIVKGHGESTTRTVTI